MENEFKFYMKPAKASEASDYIDIEKLYKCKYASFSGLTEFGEVQNTYTETYVESKEPYVYTPEHDKVTHASTDVKLTLLFLSDNSMEALDNEQKFQNYVSGRKIIYYDNFRGRYYKLLLTKAPTVGTEKLYGTHRYRSVVYTFTNLSGYYYETEPELETEEEEED